MNIPRFPLVAATCGLLLTVAPAAFADGKEYQMTGPIVSMTETTLVVQKGKSKENWEFTKSPATEGGADLKVGDRITVKYSMVASSVEEKPDKTAKPAASPAPSGSPAASPAK